MKKKVFLLRDTNQQKHILLIHSIIPRSRNNIFGGAVMICKRSAILTLTALWLCLNVSTAIAVPIDDSVTKDQNIKFNWSYGGTDKHGGFTVTVTVEGEEPFNWVILPTVEFDFRNLRPDLAGKAAKFRFHQPAGATDWKQTIVDPDGTSHVFSGNIKKGSDWEFYNLGLLPDVYFRIPDLAPISGDSSTTIYTAVDLDLYLNNNPLGFLDGAWSVGQTLDDLGISIINGETLSLQGIYWATTQFEFDSNPSGRGFTPVGGDVFLLDTTTYAYDVVVLQQHTAIPEPSTLLLLSLSVPALLLFGSRRIGKGSAVCSSEIG